MELICPVCGKPLQRQEGAFRCAQGHSFDIARQGYVNLLGVQQKHSLNPGDTREQVLARRSFLEAGFYQPIADALCQELAGFPGPLLDVGCGEGYYSVRMAQAMQTQLVGMDISKEAVRCAAGKYKGPLWLCATAAHLPVADQSVGVLTSLFALTLPEEFSRVLAPNGIFVQVLAAPDHLLGLKSVIYPQLIQKEKFTQPQLPGFTLEKSVPVKFSFAVEAEQVQNLLSMTPHVYRISKEGAQRLRQTQRLTDTASCVINLYKKEPSIR